MLVNKSLNLFFYFSDIIISFQIIVMKKLFQRMDQGSKEPTIGHMSYVGKVFTIGRHSVTVEDTIAEGVYIFL